MWIILIPALCAVSLAPFASALDNGLARTPPMGWLTWQRFRCITDCETYPDECISEALMKRTADLMVSEGYLAAGYEYLGIDDCWLEPERGSDGRLVPDRKRFPSGMKALADYIHSKGLKFALYQDYGTKTCGGYPGILGHEKLDMDTFAEWDVDYIKLDGCNVDTAKMDTGYPYVGRLINATGRPIVYSCSWPAYQKNPNYKAIKEACNLWRNYGDIQDSWASVVNIMNWFGDRSKYLAQFAGPGNWNDPDMLIVGNYALSEDQARVQMAVWAVLAAPLMMSVDLATIKPAYRDILLNKDIIAVNQDPLGRAGVMEFGNCCGKNSTCGSDKYKLWMRPLAGRSYAIAIVNLSDYGVPQKITIVNDQRSRVEDLYHEEKTRVVAPSEKYITRVNPSGVKFFKYTQMCAEDVCSQDLKLKVYDQKGRELTC